MLFLWSFASVRQWTRQTILWKIGFILPPGINPVPAEEFMPLSSYSPKTFLQREIHTPVRPMYKTIEVHGHIFRNPPEDFIGTMNSTGANFFVNLALHTTTLEKFRELKKDYPSPRIIHLPGLNWEHSKKSENFGEKMATDLEAIAKEGIKGVKIWKNFGLMERDPSGKIIPLDDPRMDPVWDVCRRYSLIVGIHTADPPAFFTKIDPENERFEELARHPEWSFYGSDTPTFDELFKQRDRLFRRHPQIRFIAQHFGELAHNLDEADRLLKENPNVYLDTAQRIDELGRQPRAARKFFLKWQDRILFGTDGLPDLEKIKIYWQFLETEDEYFDYFPSHKPRKGFWKIYGLNLPPDVLKKLYYTNAKKLLRLE